MRKEYTFANEQLMHQFAANLAKNMTTPLLLYFQGDLGAGKTSMIRAILRNLGVKGAIKSPSYALVEPYDTQIGALFHFDLYRLTVAEELEYLGFRDYLSQDAICCFEWPERADQLLPVPDVLFQFKILDQGRLLIATASSSKGVQLFEDIS